MKNSLESYGSGAWITHFIEGKTVEAALKDGQWLIIRFTDGHEARIGWQDASGNQLKGAPFLENLDCKIVLPGITVAGAGGQL